MKKNFFKKLSFVLALAMIVTALAPAAGAFAAAKPKLNAKEKTLFLSVDGKDEFDFNIANKKTGWSYKWTSANKKVATVNAKNGLVTAAGAGKTSVSVVIKDKKGEEVTTLKASVLVRDNIKELTITNLPEGDKLAVDASNDFNRSYKTVAGLTKGSQAITRWVVTDKDGKAATTATITDSGVFTASEAGEYTITANAFQSKAKYTSWLTDSEKYASYVTATATYKVTVAASIVSAKQTNLKKFDLTFDSVVKADDVKKNLVVSYLVGATKVKELVDSVSMDATGKIATVAMYLDFTKGSTYVAEYPEMGSAQFVAATTKVEDVVDIAILTTTAQTGKEKKIDVALYNKDGVNIANEDLKAKLTFEKDNNAVTLVGNSLYMYKIGDTVKITATFHTYNWVDGKEVGNVTASGVITCVELAKDAIGSIINWTVLSSTADAPSNFNTPRTQTFKNAGGKLYVLTKGVDANGDDMYRTNSSAYKTNGATDNNLWKFKSSNTAVLMVDNSGNVYGVSEGSAVVVVTNDDVQVGACEITVTAAKKVAMATVNTNSLVLSNKFNDPTEVTVEAKDQLGDTLTSGTDYTTEIVANGTYTDAPVVSGMFVDAGSAKAGTYGYTVKVKDKNDSNVVISLNLTVTVQDPGDAPVSYYKIETDKASYDVKSGSAISNLVAKLNVYGYTSAGIKTEKVLDGITGLVAKGAVVTVKDSDGTEVTTSSISGGAIISNSQIVLAGPATASAVSGAATRTIAKTVKTGNWLITATNTTDKKSVSPISFEVKNGQTAVSVSLKKNVTDVVSSLTSATDVAKVINECYSFVVGDKELTVEPEWFGVNITNYVVRNKDLTIKKIKLYQEIINDNGDGTNTFIEHEVNLNNAVVSIK